MEKMQVFDDRGIGIKQFCSAFICEEKKDMMQNIKNYYQVYRVEKEFVDSLEPLVKEIDECVLTFEDRLVFLSNGLFCF